MQLDIWSDRGALSWEHLFYENLICYIFYRFLTSSAIFIGNLKILYDHKVQKMVLYTRLNSPNVPSLDREKSRNQIQINQMHFRIRFKQFRKIAPVHRNQAELFRFLKWPFRDFCTRMWYEPLLWGLTSLNDKWS